MQSKRAIAEYSAAKALTAMPSYRREELKAQYAEFCEECAKDFEPVEVEYGGLPTFIEWYTDKIAQEARMEWQRNQNQSGKF